MRTTGRDAHKHKYESMRMSMRVSMRRWNGMRNGMRRMGRGRRRIAKKMMAEE